MEQKGNTQNTKYLHPFYHGLRNVPEGRIKELQKVRTWVAAQPHLPEVSDDYIYVFLSSCNFSVDRAKSCIEHYFTIKTNHPAIFGNRDPEDEKVKLVRSLGHLWRLPKLTPEGYRMVMYAVRDGDPTKMVFSECVKTFCMFNDIVLSEDGIEDGYIVIFDMKGVQLGHLARISLPALRCFFLYIQEAHPVKIKGVHVLNTASWVHHIMRIVIPLVKSELLSLVKFHKGNIPDGLPLEIMPKEYGGQTCSMEELDHVTEHLWEKYRPWLLENETLKTNETKRNQKKSSWWGLPFFGNKEELNEKNIIKNLR
ncbi:alpha-tocopherol transfer protein-like isoform X2 [Diabrotica undecimpunctata]